MGLMKLTIELPTELAAGLAERASALGVSVSEYVERLLREQLSGAPSLSAAERAAAWRELSGRYPHTPPLPDSAISRESIYGDHA
jgi:hypothetical protein